MDANKLAKLQEIRYRILPVCENCSLSKFSNTTVMYGECKYHEYHHLKHSDAQRPLSIFRHGHCDHHKFSPIWKSAIGTWAPFVEEVG